MVQIVENWTCITGIVLSCTQAPAQGTLRSGEEKPPSIEITIEKAEAVEGFRSLIAQSPGERMTILLPDRVDGIGTGMKGRRITVPVRMVRAGRYFAAPDWTPAAGSKQCGPNPSADNQK
jgi:hypothetical protein